MSRRADPERIDAARRAAAFARLIGEGELPERAEARIVAWERAAAAEGRACDRASWEAFERDRRR